MRGRITWLAYLFVAGLALRPAAAYGQEGAQFPRPWAELPLPIGHDRIDKGGLYLGAEFVMWKQSNPIHGQQIAVSGLQEFQGGTSGITGIPGAFLGNGNERLNAESVAGPSTFQPGFKIFGGWRFQDGSALEVSYINLQKAVYTHTATQIPQNGQFGDNGADLFLFSPVFNFPHQYGGPLIKAFSAFPFILPGDFFGIWNGAVRETIEFDQRTSQIEAMYRIPIFEQEYCRIYGYVGPRFFWIWERFKWTTWSADPAGNEMPEWAAVYTNIVSNRMYGAFVGSGQEVYLGHGVAVSLDVECALLLDVARERAEYELLAEKVPPINKRTITDYSAVPEPAAKVNLWWYPYEGIQLRVGYEVMGFFFTKGFHEPVDFNWGAVNPQYIHTNRLFHGLNAGLALIF